MRSRKGQDAIPAATLVLLIALFIIGYVILLPSSEREELLKQDKGPDDITTKNKTILDDRGTYTLLSEIPGDLFPFEKRFIVKEISPINLFSKVDDRLINLATNVRVSANLFQDSPRRFSFNIRDLDATQNLKLFFFVKSSDGPLKVEVNNAVIFEGEISSNDLPIQIPVDVLKENNVLILSVKGSLFGNSYELSNLYLKQEFLVENKIAKRSFVISRSEKRGVEDAMLYYFLNCRTLKEQGLLSIFINDKLISSRFVVCDSRPHSLEIDGRKLISGENELMFKISKGDYSIEDIELEIEIGAWTYPKYSFRIDDAVYDEIFCEEGICSDVVLGMLFRNDERKKATVTINEFEVNFDTYGFEHYIDLTRFVKYGDNALKIIPKTEFRMDHLSVFVE